MTAHERERERDSCIEKSHRAVLASARHRADQLMGKKPWRPKTRVFMACNPASNAGPCVLDYHAVIWCGVPLYVMPRFDVPSFCRNVERYKVEACLIAPWVVAACLANDPPTGGQAYDLSSLRWVSAAGSRVEPQIVRRAKERIGVDVLNEYGQTEILCMFDFDEPGLIEKGKSNSLPLLSKNNDELIRLGLRTSGCRQAHPW